MRWNRKGARQWALWDPLGLNFQGCQEKAVMLGKEYCMHKSLAIKKKSVNPDKIFLGWKCAKKKQKNGLKKRLKNPGLGLKTRLW